MISEALLTIRLFILLYKISKSTLSKALEQYTNIKIVTFHSFFSISCKILVSSLSKTDFFSINQNNCLLKFFSFFFKLNLTIQLSKPWFIFIATLCSSICSWFPIVRKLCLKIFLKVELYWHLKKEYGYDLRLEIVLFFLDFFFDKFWSMNQFSGKCIFGKVKCQIFVQFNFLLVFWSSETFNQ